MEDKNELNEENIEESVKSEETAENPEVIEDTNIEEAAELSEVNEETNINEAEELEEQEEKPLKKSFFRTFEAALIDGIIMGMISFVLLYVINFFMKFAGYYIVQKLPMMFIIYAVVSILYPSIMEATKAGSTFGKKLSSLKVTLDK